MKNKKLKLDAIKVQSFVTSMGSKEKQTVNGGAWDFDNAKPGDLLTAFYESVEGNGACSVAGWACAPLMYC